VKPVRFFCRPIREGLNELTEAESHHLSKVRRLGLGNVVELFDGSGVLAEARITGLGSRKVLLQVEHLELVERPKHSEIVIAAGVGKGDSFDLIVGKCTELGVDRLCPILYQRGVKRPQGKNVSERYEKLAIAAAKQCGRLFLPQIDEPSVLDEALEFLKAAYGKGQVLIGSLNQQAEPLIRKGLGNSDILAFVGPEGGLTKEEESLLRERGGQEVRLADTVLRVETAAVTFAAILNAQRDAERG